MLKWTIILNLIPMISVAHRLQGENLPGRWLWGRSLVYWGIVIGVLMFLITEDWISSTVCGMSYMLFCFFDGGEYQSYLAWETPTKDSITDWLMKRINPYYDDDYTFVGNWVRSTWPVIPMSIYFWPWFSVPIAIVFGLAVAYGGKVTLNRFDSLEKQECITGALWGCLLLLTLI